jgi:glucose dehydrogenase
MITAALREQPTLRQHTALFSVTRWATRVMAASAAVLLTPLAAVSPAPAADARPVDAKALLGAADNRSDWLTHGRTYDEQRFSPLAQINTGNVKNLGLAWYADLDTARGQEGTPLVIDGTIYITHRLVGSEGVRRGLGQIALGI